MRIISGPAGGAGPLGCEKKNKRRNNPRVIVTSWTGMVRPARFSSILVWEYFGHLRILSM
jgi:hypothetical protein